MDGYGPSLAEILQSSHPGWLIWREMLEDGGHGDWCAQPAHATGDDTVLRHTTVEGLAELLEQTTAGRTDG
ncbi:hypothetical protein GCM10017673_38970 [Streptosporangium violaceochromogenes]|nr:hypothetical protein GCM10017673_38970 [Streptosporangium violaceochromogenes]